MAKKIVKMSLKDLKKEHQHLNKVLVKGGKKARLAEAKSQKKEMSKYR